MTVKMSEKHQVTVPKSIATTLGLGRGSLLELYFRPSLEKFIKAMGPAV